jgi:hypothetical protein
MLLFDRFFAAGDLFQQTPGTDDESEIPMDVVIDNEMRSQGAVMFHELLHFVSRSDASQAGVQSIIDRARQAQPERFAVVQLDPPIIYDVAFDDFEALDEGTRELDQITRGHHEANTVAYGLDRVTRLASMSYGRYAAALNADSITALAVGTYISTVQTI